MSFQSSIGRFTEIPRWCGEACTQDLFLDMQVMDSKTRANEALYAEWLWLE